MPYRRSRRARGRRSAVAARRRRATYRARRRIRVRGRVSRTHLNARRQVVRLSGLIYDYGTDQNGEAMTIYNSISETDGNFGTSPYLLGVTPLMNPFTFSTLLPILHGNGVAIDGAGAGVATFAAEDQLRFADAMANRFRMYKVNWIKFKITIAHCCHEVTGSSYASNDIRPSVAEVRRLYTPGSPFNTVANDGYEMDDMTDWRRAKVRPRVTRYIHAVKPRKITQYYDTTGTGGDDKAVLQPPKERTYTITWRNPLSFARRKATDASVRDLITPDGYALVDMAPSTSNHDKLSTPMKCLMIESRHNATQVSNVSPVIVRVYVDAMVTMRDPVDGAAYV